MPAKKSVKKTKSKGLLRSGPKLSRRTVILVVALLVVFGFVIWQWVSASSLQLTQVIQENSQWAHHDNGFTVAIPGGFAWQNNTDSNNKNYTWNGPYFSTLTKDEVKKASKSGDPWHQRVCFLMKSDGYPTVELSVTRSAGSVVLSKKTVHPNNIFSTQGNCIDFRAAPSQYNYEFRAKVKHGTVRIDHIELYAGGNFFCNTEYNTIWRQLDGGHLDCSAA